MRTPPRPPSGYCPHCGHVVYRCEHYGIYHEPPNPPPPRREPEREAVQTAAEVNEAAQRLKKKA